MHRIVHLDLKGAPLKVNYLEQVIQAAKLWGATGILLEWEDTFPYSAALADIGSVRGSGGDGMYSLDEVRYIMRFIKDTGLEPIQLIQTIGHLEFVLKQPAYHSLRELARSPAVLCPSRPEALQLVKMMLDQALDAQPLAEYLHIGADEVKVWHTAVCPECQNRAANNIHNTASLYLEHIRELAWFVKQKRPNLTVLMWDDMLRSVKSDTLIAYQLGELVQPVVWQYNAMEHFQIDPGLWETYRQIFPQLWAGSAFKGANGSCQILSPVRRYVSNQDAWRRELKKCGNSVNFAGVILTGWSRFDHYATLCELLPVSLPSLACCLKAWTRDASTESLVNEVLPSEQWPGEQLARCIHSFVIIRERCFSFIHGDLVKTWLNPWQIENGYTNPVQVEGLAVTSQQLLIELNSLQTELTRNLYAITGSRSAREWMETFSVPLLRQLAVLRDAATTAAKSDASVRPRHGQGRLGSYT